MQKDFRLESVHKYKKHILDLERDKLLYLFNIKDELECRKNEIIEKINLNKTEIEELKKRGDFTFIELYEKYINNLYTQHQKVCKYIESVDREIEKQRKIVLEARTEKLVLDNLETKHIESYKAFQRKMEEKFIDEINSIHYGYKDI
ncbi:MAG: flagellar FliJ family protein [Deferribacterota bacterium]|nr:flagellar FliJ family protein [Deferribacterota bacterium]